MFVCVVVLKEGVPLDAGWVVELVALGDRALDEVALLEEGEGVVARRGLLPLLLVLL